MKLILRLLICIAAVLPLAMASEAAPQKARTEVAQQKKNRTNKKSSAPKKQKNKNSSGKRRNTAKEPTSAEIKKKQEATQQEIRETRVKIRENDASIKRNLAELSKLETDITATKSRVSKIGTQVSGLERKISGLNSSIDKNEAELKVLREKYLKAVKKMRLAKANKSDLAFLFSSKTFNQALRRMRYLKQFARWRDRQTATINAKVNELKTDRQLLAQAVGQKRVALAEQVKAKTTLEQQHSKQDAIVVQLRAEGTALQAHLAEKQAEANALKNQISALIAAEQAKAAERHRKEAEAREAKALAEKEAKAKREAELKAKNEEKTLAQVKPTKEDSKSKKEKPKKEKTKKENKKKTSKKQQGGKEYADARKRKPRSESDGNAASKSSSEAPAKSPSGSGANAAKAASGFEAARGSLPRPVAGSFKVVSNFGRHTLPELPDVTYDNPGIDAEVSPGSSAKAVYAGKVSGVYVLKGFATVVIVNHGSYYTVYGNLTSPNVKVGDTVKQGDTLGKVVSDKEDGGRSIVHFEVWHNREKLNPMNWIR